MYYVKIPFRHLSEPHLLNVAEDIREIEWQKRLTSLLEDLSSGVIPAWSVDYRDLQNLVLYREEIEEAEK